MQKGEATPTEQTDLKDFVRETVQEILAGVEEARSKTEDEETPNYNHTGTQINFDLAVTTSNSGGSEGKFSIGVSQVLAAGIEAGESEESTSKNRVQFSIPVQVKPVASGRYPKTAHDNPTIV